MSEGPQGQDQKVEASWIEVFPYGVTSGLERGRPVLLFQDEAEKHMIPIWVSPVEANVAVSQHYVTTDATSPHNLSSRIFKDLGLKIEKCVFNEVRGNHQYMDIHLGLLPAGKVIRSRVDQCLSLCMHEQARFFCTPEFIEQCREQDSELSSLLMGAELHPDFIKNPHSYLM